MDNKEKQPVFLFCVNGMFSGAIAVKLMMEYNKTSAARESVVWKKSDEDEKLERFLNRFWKMYQLIESYNEN